MSQLHSLMKLASIPTFLAIGAVWGHDSGGFFSAQTAVEIAAPCVICEGGCGGDEGGHISASAEAGSRHGSAHPGMCGPGTCNGFHPTGCDGGLIEHQQQALRSEWSAVLRGNFAEVADQLRDHGHRIRVSERAMAIQWLDCNEEVIASLPIDAESMLSVRALADQ